MLQLHWVEIPCIYLVKLALFKLNAVRCQYSLDSLIQMDGWIGLFLIKSATYPRLSHPQLLATNSRGQYRAPLPQTPTTEEDTCLASKLVKSTVTLSIKMLLRTVRPWVLRCGTQSLTCSRSYYADKVARIGSQPDKQSSEYQVCWFIANLS